MLNYSLEVTTGITGNHSILWPNTADGAVLRQREGELRHAAQIHHVSFYTMLPLLALEVNWHNENSYLAHSQGHVLSFCEELTKVKLLGEAAQRLILVRFHSWITSLVFSSTLITLSLVIPSKRGTSLFLPFIFSCRRLKETECQFGNKAAMLTAHEYF